jgi:hypothetical protein
MPEQLERWLQARREAEAIVRDAERRYAFARGMRGDFATAEVCKSVDVAAGTSIAGTSIGIINTSPTWPGSLGATGQQSEGGFWRQGRAVMGRFWGTTTTSTTPGTLTIDLRLDTTGGTLLVTSGALTLIASQTTSSWKLEFDVTCRTVGTAGTVMAMGKFEAGAAIFAAGSAFLPATAPATATMDTTANHNFVVCVTETNASTSSITQLAYWLARN